MKRGKILFFIAFVCLVILTTYSPGGRGEDDCIVPMLDLDGNEIGEVLFTLTEEDTVRIRESANFLGEFYPPSYRGERIPSGVYYFETYVDKIPVVASIDDSILGNCLDKRGLRESAIVPDEGEDETSDRPSGRGDGEGGEPPKESECDPPCNENQEEVIIIHRNDEGEDERECVCQDKCPPLGFPGRTERCPREGTRLIYPRPSEDDVAVENIFTCCDPIREKCQIENELPICKLKDCGEITDMGYCEERDDCYKKPKEGSTTQPISQLAPFLAFCEQLLKGSQQQQQEPEYECAARLPCVEGEWHCKGKNNLANEWEEGDACCLEGQENVFINGQCSCADLCKEPYPEKCFALDSYEDNGFVIEDDYTCCDPESEDCDIKQIDEETTTEQGYRWIYENVPPGAAVCKPKTCGEIRDEEACELRPDCQAAYGYVSGERTFVGCEEKSGEGEEEQPEGFSCPADKKMCTFQDKKWCCPPSSDGFCAKRADLCPGEARRGLFGEDTPITAPPYSEETINKCFSGAHACNIRTPHQATEHN